MKNIRCFFIDDEGNVNNADLHITTGASDECVLFELVDNAITFNFELSAEGVAALMEILSNRHEA